MIKVVLLFLLLLVPVVIVTGTAWKVIEYRKNRYERVLANIEQLEKKLEIE